jgi:dolichol-phosphate mannosyltransferase
MLSLVIPTYNERKSLQALLPRLAALVPKLGGPVEFIIVDDNSPDETADFAANFEVPEPAVIRVVKRAGKFGLASAVIEGWRTARGSVLGVMDADGSHDELIIPEMLEALREGPAELAVGSRYVPGGGLGDWPLSRRLISRFAVFLGSFLCPAKDVTSGFIMFRREVLEGVSLDPIGFKIGLEVMVRGRYRTFTEIPYVFSDRKRGSSKLSSREVGAYLVQLARLFSYRWRHPHQRRRWTRVVS